jgi:hypothetical protein
VGPAFHEGVAGIDLFDTGGVGGVEVEELNVMTGIGFVDADDVCCVDIELCQPVFFLFCGPGWFDGGYIIIGFGGFFLEGTGDIHGGGAGGPCVFGCFLADRAYFGGEGDDLVIDEELPDRLQLFTGVGDQAVGGGVFQEAGKGGFAFS